MLDNHMVVLSTSAVLWGGLAAKWAAARLHEYIENKAERIYCDRLHQQCLARLRHGRIYAAQSGRVESESLSTGIASPAERVPEGHQGSVERLTGDVSGINQGLVPDSSVRFPGVESKCGPETTANHASALVFMRPADHIMEFLDEVRANQLGRNPISGRQEATYTDKSLVAAYHTFARSNSIAVIATNQFLKLIAKQDGVIKSRDRRKDAFTGQVIKNANKTPLRDAHYTIRALEDEQRRSSKKPRKVAGLSPIERSKKLMELEGEKLAA